MNHTLNGNWKTKEVILDGLLLDPKPSQQLRNISPDGFTWGTEECGDAQLALAIMLKLTGRASGYYGLKVRVLRTLVAGKDFNIHFEFNNIRIQAMHDAMAHNKYLTKEFLKEKTDEELLCFMHPMSREFLEKEMFK